MAFGGTILDIKIYKPFLAFKWRHDLTFEEVDSIQNACREFLSVLGLKNSQKILNSHGKRTFNSVPITFNPSLLSFPNLKPFSEFGYFNVTAENFKQIGFKCVHFTFWVSMPVRWRMCTSINGSKLLVINLFWTQSAIIWDDKFKLDWIICDKIQFLKSVFIEGIQSIRTVLSADLIYVLAPRKQ